MIQFKEISKDFGLEHASSNVHENQKGLEVSGTCHLLVCAVGIDLNGNIRKNTEAL
jgi:hypothetical protein